MSAAAIIKDHVNKELITTMVDDGWTVHAGPWGYSETERTVELRKTHAPFNGVFKVWLTDRNFGVQHHVGHSAWLVTGEGSRVRERSFTVENFTEYSFSAYVHAAGVCDISGEYHGFENLVHVAYANAVAPQYAAEASAKWETPGWSN